MATVYSLVEMIKTRSSAFVAVILISFLAGCASPRTQDFSPQGGISINTKSSSIFVATNRVKQADSTALTFGRERSDTVSYGKFDVSIPPNHKVGNIEWAKGKPDPSRHFATISSKSFSSAPQFRKQLALAAQRNKSRTPTGKKEVVLFVHGYNTPFDEGVYRAAQIRHDYDLAAPMVLFSWPSAGRPGLYVYDRDSVIVSRDSLVDVITQLHQSDVDQITLIAHSMGSSLLMESLRQIHISGRAPILSKLDGVVLLSPDIDIDVFNTQLDQISPLPRPFMIFASQKDEALEISSFLTGRQERIGNNLDLNKIEHPGVSVVDITDFKGGDSLNHFSVATSPALVKLLKGLQHQTTLDAISQDTDRQSLGSQIAGTATLPLRILTTTTQAVFSQ